MTPLHGAAARSHGTRIVREHNQRARSALLDLRGRLVMAGVRMPEGADLADGVIAGVEALLEERRTLRTQDKP